MAQISRCRKQSHVTNCEREAEKIRVDVLCSRAVIDVGLIKLSLAASGCEAFRTRSWSHGNILLSRNSFPPHRWKAAGSPPCSSCSQWEIRVLMAVRGTRWSWRMDYWELCCSRGPGPHYSGLFHGPWAFLSPAALLPWWQPRNRGSFLFTLKNIPSLALWLLIKRVSNGHQEPPCFTTDIISEKDPSVGAAGVQ